MERIYVVAIVLLVIGLSLGLGLGLGLKKSKSEQNAVQVYGRMTKKNSMNEYEGTGKVWVYPLYTSENRAKELYGSGNYHFHMFEGCSKKYYMSNNIVHNFNQVKGSGINVDTCDGKLPETSGGSSGSSSGYSSY